MASVYDPFSESAVPGVCRILFGLKILYVLLAGHYPKKERASHCWTSVYHYGHMSFLFDPSSYNPLPSSLLKSK